MKKIYFLAICVLVLKFTGNCQGWVGDGGTILYSVNNDLDIAPIKVGIGTSNPTTQFHTTGSVRFGGLTNDNTQSRLIVSDASGKLYYRDASTLSATNAWLTTGNTLTGSEFLGSVNNFNVAFRTNNTQRMLIGANGNIAVNSTDLTPALFSVSNSVEDFNYFASGLSPSYVLSQKTFRESPTGGSVSPFGTLGLATRAGAYGAYTVSGDLAVVNYNQNAIVFVTQERQYISDPTHVTDEKMRITGTGFVGINTHAPTAMLHVVLPADKSGNIRFENLATGSGKILVVDASGNLKLSTTTSSILGKQHDNEIDNLRSQIQDLQSQISELKSMVLQKSSSGNSSAVLTSNAYSYLGQNIPNPSTNATQIAFNIVGSYASAYIQFVQAGSGAVIKKVNLSKGQSSLNIATNNLASGTYFYSLVVNGQTLATKSMIISKN